MKAMMLLSVVSLATSASLAAGHKESKDGDLSDHGLAPTAVVLKTGANTIAGKFGSVVKRDGTRVDLDYLTFTVPEGQALDSIYLDPKTDVGGAFSFIGLQAGDQFTVPPNGSSAAELLGWAHFGSGDEGRNLLPDIAAGPGAIGFVPPLGPGTYSVWLQELAVCACKYRLVFNIGTRK